MTSIVTFRAEDGNALGRILTLSDISQVRRLAMEKERFIRTMVHELKSPLGAVRSIIEVTTDKSMGDDLEAYLPLLRRAETRIDDLVQLISDLLSLSKSEQAQAASEPQLLEVAPLVEAALAGQAEHLAARGITASADLEPELPPVLAPVEDLEMILTNLVGNAVKYNRDGGSVTVRALHEGEWVRIDVEDTRHRHRRRRTWIRCSPSSSGRSARRPRAWKAAAWAWRSSSASPSAPAAGCNWPANWARGRRSRCSCRRRIGIGWGQECSSSGRSLVQTGVVTVTATQPSSG